MSVTRISGSPHLAIQCSYSVVYAYLTIQRGTGLSATQRVKASTITIMYEFLSEDSDKGPFVSNDILWSKYRLCPLKLCFSANCFWCGYGVFN